MKLRAIFTIEYGNNGHEATGQYDQNGVAILRPLKLVAHPGDVFEVDDPDSVARLLELKAVEVVPEESPQKAKSAVGKVQADA